MSKMCWYCKKEKLKLTKRFQGCCKSCIRPLERVSNFVTTSPFHEYDLALKERSHDWNTVK